MYPIELQAKIQEYRQKAAAGQMTEEEAVEFVAMIRQGNRAAAAVGSVKAKKEKAVPSAESLLDELKGL